MTDSQEQPGDSAPLTPPAPAELREKLLTMVLNDLHGPAGGAEEEITESVRERYLVGMLAPRKQQEGVNPATQDDILSPGDEAPDDGPAEQSVSQAPTLFPSSFGLTCCIDSDATHLEITATWGRYHRVASAVQKDPTTGDPLRVWKRQPMGSTTTIPLHEGDIAPWQPEPEEQPEVFVRGLARRGNESWIVTLFLVNGQEEAKPKDATWIFQPELSLRATDGAAIFRRRAWADVPPHMGAEERDLVMRYRNQIEFAVGHGVSVRAETAHYAETTGK